MSRILKDPRIWLLGLGLWAVFVWDFRMGALDTSDGWANEIVFSFEPLLHLFTRIPWKDQSPLYLVVMHYWGHLFGRDLVSMRILATILSFCIVVVVYLLTKQFFGQRRYALLTAAVFSMWPVTYWIVRHGRMYTPLLLLTLLGILFLFRYLESNRPRDLMWLSLTCVLNIYNHFIGFYLTAMLLGFIFLNLVVENFVVPQKRAPFLPRFNWLALAALLVTLGVIPQVDRMTSLMHAPPLPNVNWSVPDHPFSFFMSLVNFNFINSSWGISYEPFVSILKKFYSALILILCGLGLALAPRRLRWFGILWIFGSVILFYYGSQELDLRARYTIYALPLVLIMMCYGTLAPLTWALRSKAIRFLNMMRWVAFLMVIILAGTLFYQASHASRMGWSKLLKGIQQFHTPRMNVYMDPSFTRSLVHYPAHFLPIDPQFRKVPFVNKHHRKQFQRQIQAGDDFIVLVYQTHKGIGEEFSWWHERLLESGYQKDSLFAANVRAEIYTHEPLNIYDHAQLSPEPQSSEILTWIRGNQKDQVSEFNPREKLKDAVVCRIEHQDGTLLKSNLYYSEPGELGSWKLGREKWKFVREEAAHSGNQRMRDMIWAHPVQDSTLAIAIPNFPAGKSLKVTYGLRDLGRRINRGEDVNITVFAEDTEIGRFTHSNLVGWQDLWLPTEQFKGQEVLLTFMIETPNSLARHFMFNFKASHREVYLSGAPNKAQQPERSLKASIRDWRVFRRVSSGATLSSSYQKPPLSAKVMHEVGQGEVGSLRQRWSLGPQVWDSAGIMQQTSGGEMREAIWAHPKNDTTLVLEIGEVIVDDFLEGYLGLTDHAVKKAQGMKTSSPIQFKVLLDDEVIYDTAHARQSGWKPFRVPVPDRLMQKPVKLTVEVMSDSDRWGHLIFDLTNLAQYPS